jgi:hypothetical protein
VLLVRASVVLMTFPVMMLVKAAASPSGSSARTVVTVAGVSKYSVWVWLAYASMMSI